MAEVEQAGAPVVEGLAPTAEGGAPADPAPPEADAQAQQPEQDGATEEQLSALNALLSTDKNERSDFVNMLDELSERNGGKPFRVSKDQMDALPIEAKQLLSNQRKMVLRKADDLHRQTTELAAERQALAQERERMQAERAALLGMFADPELQKLVNIEKQELDPLSPEGMAQAGSIAAARVLQQFMERVGTVSEEHKQAAAAALKERHEAEQVTLLQADMAANPEWWKLHQEKVRDVVAARNINWDEAKKVVEGWHPAPETAEQLLRRQRRSTASGNFVPLIDKQNQRDDVLAAVRETPGSADLEALKRRTGISRRR